MIQEAEFGYNDNAIRNQKMFYPLAHGNVADWMVALPDKALPCQKYSKKE